MVAPRKPETRREIYAGLLKRNPAARVPDGLDEAYVGYTIGADAPVAVYDYDHSVRILMKQEKSLTEEDALKMFELAHVLVFDCDDAPIFVRFQG